MFCQIAGPFTSAFRGSRKEARKGWPGQARPWSRVQLVGLICKWSASRLYLPALSTRHHRVFCHVARQLCAGRSGHTRVHVHVHLFLTLRFSAQDAAQTSGQVGSFPELIRKEGKLRRGVVCTEGRLKISLTRAVMAGMPEEESGPAVSFFSWCGGQSTSVRPGVFLRGELQKKSSGLPQGN